MDEAPKQESEQPEQTGVSAHMGFPNPAVDKSLLGLDLNQLLIRHTASTYLFRITGNDWAEVGLFPGDIAIIDRALAPRKNDLVIWWNEQTGDFAISFYHAMPTDATAWGIVTNTIHRFRP